MAAVRSSELRARLCVMAKAPIAGKVKTRLCPPYQPEQAAQLAAAFLLDTWSVAESALDSPPLLAVAGRLSDFPTELRFVESFAQRGADLGERISAAIVETLAATGVINSSQRNPSDPSRQTQAALIIGSDLPGLPGAQLRAALELLTSHDVCIGPSGDGGFYLIGVRRWLPEALADIAWSTDQARAQTIENLRGHGLSVALAAEYNDIDDSGDLDELLGSDRHAPRTRSAFARIQQPKHSL